MKTLAIVLAATLMVALPATAYAATAAPAATPGSCDSLLRTPVECAIWALKCIGDALGGNACHGRAAVAPAEGPKEFVECTVGQVEQILNGVTPMPCALEAAPAGALAPPDVEKIVECTKSHVKQILQGVTPMPCDV